MFAPFHISLCIFACASPSQKTAGMKRMRQPPSLGALHPPSEPSNQFQVINNCVFHSGGWWSGQRAEREQSFVLRLAKLWGPGQLSWEKLVKIDPIFQTW